MSASLQPGPHVVEHFDAGLLDARRHQRRGADDAHAGAERAQRDDVGARDARMQDVAADRDRQPLDAAAVAADGQRVEQRLGRMLVRAVAGVDDGAIDLARQQMRGAGLMVAHDDDVGPHGVERDRGVDQRLALLHAGGGDRHVHHVGAEPLAREFERGLRAGRGLEEQIDERAPAQGGAFLLHLPRDVDGGVGEIEQVLDLGPRQALDAEQVAAGEDFGGMSESGGTSP